MTALASPRTAKTIAKITGRLGSRYFCNTDSELYFEAP
jgi:hypothetical protein